jgi:F-type H+-transporting ATPase subunit delta
VSVQARPQDYAAAIYDLAFESWLRALGDAQKALKDSDVRAAVEDPNLPTQEKLQALAQAMPGGLNGEPRKLLGTLIEAGQLGDLDAIVIELGRYARDRQETTVAQVTSAVPLTDGEKDALRAKVSERFGPELEFEFDVDEALIGGVYLRVGDKVIDGTVAGKLAAMRDQLDA